MIFEDECYSDLIWSGERPRSIYSMANGEGVIFIGSFSKSIAPALRVGYIVAKWDILARILGLKQDAGSGALEQMVLAEFCTQHFATHVPKLNKTLQAKLQVLREALAEQFGTAAEFGDPAGGIYLWIKLPDGGRHARSWPRRPLPPACRSIPGRNGRPTRPMPRTGCASASPIPSPRRSGRASPCWPRSAAANSASRCAAPTSTGKARVSPSKVDHFLTHLVVPRSVQRTVPQTAVKTLIRQRNHP